MVVGVEHDPTSLDTLDPASIVRWIGRIRIRSLKHRYSAFRVVNGHAGTMRQVFDGSESTEPVPIHGCQERKPDEPSRHVFQPNARIENLNE
jgi:hypothetical protein